MPAPIIINTPYLDPSLVSKEMKAKLEAIQDEARDYLAGKRAQVSLFDQDDVEEVEEKGQNSQSKKGRTLAELRKLLGTEEPAGGAA